MRILKYTDADFAEQLASLNRESTPDEAVEQSVRDIITEVRRDGDAALIKLAAKFDRATLASGQLRVTPAELKRARKQVESRVRSAIKMAHENVRDFALRSKRENWSGKNRQGVKVGERFDAFERVGIYVPAGTAPLASTVIMTVTLAAAAGVPEIVVVSPVGPGAEVNSAVLHALSVCGATEVYKIGGAQAIAALAYGTETIRPVVKIFGPGNPWVVEAKRQVFGRVAIDLLPGPSEILVIADASANPAFIAADLLAQAEHGHGSSIGFVTNSARLITSRQEHLREVLENNTFLVQVKSLDQAVRIANEFAPEHLSIAAKDEEKLAKDIRTAGAIFLGALSPVVGGDFVAGPSHELPTGGAGKSFGGLTVDQFQRRTSIVRFNATSLRKSYPTIRTFSEVEGLDAHGRSAAIRLE
jgi:histidinol dehydrogenase